MQELVWEETPSGGHLVLRGLPNGMGGAATAIVSRDTRGVWFGMVRAPLMGDRWRVGEFPTLEEAKAAVLGLLAEEGLFPTAFNQLADAEVRVHKARCAVQNANLLGRATEADYASLKEAEEALKQLEERFGNQEGLLP